MSDDKTKGLFAAGAAALGLAGSGESVAEANAQQSLGTGVVFMDDYDPGVPFTVVSRIQQPTVNDILGEQQEGQAVVDPTDYNGYLVHDQCNEQAPGSFSLVFTREETLETNQDYSFTDQAVIFSNELYLIEAQLERVQAGGGGNAADGGQGGNETDGEQVVVNATETEDGG